MNARRVGRMGLLATGLAALWFGAWSCGGGGGGGGGGDGGQAAPQLPSSVTYTAARGGLEFQFDGATYRATLDLGGTYRKAARSYTLDVFRDENGAFMHVPRLTVDAVGESAIPGLAPRHWGLVVLEPVQWRYGSHPATGALRLISGNYIDIRATRNVGGSGQAGVDLEYVAFGSTAGASSHTWAEFEALAGNPEAAPYQRTASFAYFLFRVVYDHVQLVMEEFEYLSENDTDLQAAGSGVELSEPCDLYQGARGTRRFAWNDGPGENPGELGPGDRFQIAFQVCYRDRGDARGFLAASGGVGIEDYVEGLSPFALGSLDTRFELRSAAVSKAGAAPAPGPEVNARSFGFVGDDPSAAVGFQVFLTPDTSTRINAGNAWRVAEAAIEALWLPPQAGGFALDRFLDVIEGEPAAAFCEGGGTYAVTPAPTANPAPGSTFAASFANCTTAGPDPVTFQGTLTLRVDESTGPLSSAGNYAIAFTLDPIAVTTTDAVGPNTLSGATRFQRTASAGAHAETSRSVSGKTLTTSESEFSAVLGPYDLSSGRTAAGAYSFGASGQSARVDRSDIGVLNVQVRTPLAGAGETPPTQGEVRVVAEDGSRLTVAVGPGGVTLAADADGDGTAEDTLGPVPWDPVFD